MNKYFYRLLVPVFLFGLAAQSPAPINGKMNGGEAPPIKKLDNERTLEQAQQHQIVQGEVGTVQESTAETHGIQAGTSSVAANMLVAKNQDLHPSEAEQQRANHDLAQANSRLESGSKNYLLIAFAILAGAFGTLFGLRRWADKNIPEMPTKVSKSSSDW